MQFATKFIAIAIIDFCSLKNHLVTTGQMAPCLVIIHVPTSEPVLWEHDLKQFLGAPYLFVMCTIVSGMLVT